MSALEQRKFPQKCQMIELEVINIVKISFEYWLASHQSHPANSSNRAFLSLASCTCSIWCTRQSLCMNGVKSLLSLCCMLLGYSFEFSPNSRAAGTAGSVLIIGLSRKKTSLTRENKIDLSKSSGLRRFQRFNIHVIQAGTLFVLLSQENKQRFSQGASESPFNNSLFNIFFPSLFLRSLYILSSLPVYLSTMFKVCV